MSGKFNGFSQDEIVKAKLKPHQQKDNAGKMATRTNLVKKIAPKKIPLSLENSDSSVNISQHPIQEQIHFRPVTTSKEPITNSSNDENSILHLDQDKINDLNKLNGVESTRPGMFQGMSLKDFEATRKLMEEQNRQKTDLLYKALAQKSEQSAAETRKIEEVKEELRKLDNDLALDVSILRKKIETASLNYMNIQKQYQQIESMFLKAKVDLFNASEQKELLTEHLCTIIAHNEQRKNNKLSELMSKVGLQQNDEDPEITN